MSKWKLSYSRSGHLMAAYVAAALVAIHGYVAAGGPAPPAPGVLLYASFDGDAVEYHDMGPVVENRPRPGKAGQFPNADFAVGSPVPANTVRVSYVPDGLFGGAAQVAGHRRGALAFDAVGNLLARRGTVAFWIRFDEPVPNGRNRPFHVTEYQRPMPGDYFFHWRAYSSGFSLRTSYGRDRRTSPFASWRPDPLPQPGEWQHLAIVWDAAAGRRVYWNGELVAESRRTEHRFPALDQIALGAYVGPRSWGGSPISQSFDELWVFDYPLTAEQVAALLAENLPPQERPAPSEEDMEARRRWWRNEFSLDCEGLPLWTGGVLEARQAFVARALAVKSDTRMPVDGKVSNVWPLQYHGYTSDGVDYPLDIWFGGEAEFDYVRARGDLRGRLAVGERPVLELPGSPFVQRLQLDDSVSATAAEVWRESGNLNEIEFYRFISHAEGEFAELEGGLRFAPALAENLGGLGEAGRRIAAYYPPEERTTLLAGAGAAQEGALEVAAWTPYHIVTAPLAEDAGIGKVLLDLHVDGFAEGTALAVRLYDPVTHTRVPWEFDVRLAEGAPGSRRVRLLWDGPGMLAEAGRRLWFTLLFDRPGKLLLGSGRTALTLYGSVEEQREEHFVQMERILCNQFELMSEARPWAYRRGYPRIQFKGVGEIMDLCEHLLHFHPENQTAGAVYSWILRHALRTPESNLSGDPWDEAARAKYLDADPLASMTAEVVDAPEGAPDWAVYGREALKLLRKHVDWWVHERQAPNGEFGSYYGDDTCLVNDWVNLSLIHDPGDHLKNSLRLLADYCWQNTLTDGLSRRARDHNHTYEEGTNIQSSLALMFYGAPEFIERLMAISRYYDGHITGVNPRGQRLFRSHYFSATHVNENPSAAYDRGICSIFQPGCFLVWYNGNPGVLRVLQEWMDTRLGLSAGQPSENFFGPAVDFATGLPTKSRDRYVRGGPSRIWDHLYFIYNATGEERYREALVQNLRAGIAPRGFSLSSWAEWRRLRPDEETDAAVRGIMGLGEDGEEEMEGDLRRLPTRLAWKLSGDRSVLVEAIKRIVLHMRKYLPMHTWVGQSADRVSIPQVPVTEMYLGGSASRAKMQYFHHHAVSWEGADDDVARFVAEDGPKGIKALLYSFHGEPQDVTMRVWALEHGRYRVRVGLDTADDESIGELTKEAEKRLFRYEPVRFRVPPKQVVVVEIEQIEQYHPILGLPDLAVGEARIVENKPNSHLAATIHNIGGASSPPATVYLRRGDEVLQQRALPPLEAPLDLQPKRVVVRFPDVAEKEGLVVGVKADGDAQEITLANNVRRLGGEDGE